MDRKSLVGRGERYEVSRDRLCSLSLNRCKSNEASAEKKVSSKTGSARIRWTKSWGLSLSSTHTHRKKRYWSFLNPLLWIAEWISKTGGLWFLTIALRHWPSVLFVSMNRHTLCLKHAYMGYRWEEMWFCGRAVA